MAATKDGDERVIATAQKILKSLGTTKKVKDDMILILSTFDNRFSDISDLLSSSAAPASTEERLAAVEEVVLAWGASSSTARRERWEVDGAATYLSAVDEILKLMDDLSASPSENGEFADRTENVLQLAMSKLEDEFRHILIRSTVPLDADKICGSMRRSLLSFASNDCEIEDFEGSGDDERGVCDYDDRGGSFGDAVIDLISPDAIGDLKDIAERMIRAGYEKECCQAYCSIRREGLEECLSVLSVEKLGIEEVQKIGWKILDDKMKKWSHAVKVVIKVLLWAEKKLCDQIFVGSELIGDVCFSEIAKCCVMQLMNFAEAISIGQRSSEKLFRILDMYDALVDVLPFLQALFSDDSGKFVCEEVEGVLGGLGNAAKGTLVEFENAIHSETSRKPVHGGEIHPLTRYVLNYLNLLVDYSDSLNLILKNGVVDSKGLGDDHDGDDDENSINKNKSLHSGDGSPFAQRLLLLISSLICNLDDKSKLYEDKAMQYIFLMNNLLYVVQKVRESEVGKLLGDQWIRKHRSQIRQYSTSYLRASWSKVLSCLKDEGLGSGGSSSIVSKVALKERFKNFNLSFEDVYRNQTTWKVPDPQLREELRISISEKVLPAYRSFLGRFRAHIERGRHPEKYIKYTPEDLENYLSDFFEGNSGALHHLRKKLSG